MRTETPLREGLWNELIDRDLNLLIEGNQPFNKDLAPLESFVISLGDFADIPVSSEFVQHHAAEAAAMVQPVESTAKYARLTRSRGLAFGLKRRVGAAATSLAMIVGMTGVAWAADSAVPGDWNYGIDRALEVVGIGAGGAEERLNELAATTAGEVPGKSVSESGRDPESRQDESSVVSDVVGLDNAAATVAEITGGSQNANDVRSGASSLLDYLATTGEIDGQTVADYARQVAPGQEGSDSNRPKKAGKPG
jgi:hypothetical protein